MNITRSVKRFTLIGCSHGHLADPHALSAVLKFCKSYKPHIRVHLGDFVDMATFRSGAAGTSDETASIEDDLRHGLNFLREYRPTLLLNGNHEIRLWKLAEHHNEIISRAAKSVITEIRDLAGKMKTQYFEKYDINADHPKIGDYTAMHGYVFGENAIRDHAEMFGNCFHAHTHRSGSAPGRRADRPNGYCVGTLSNVAAMTYANTRRATLGWDHALISGELWGDECRNITLHKCAAKQASTWKIAR